VIAVLAVLAAAVGALLLLGGAAPQPSRRRRALPGVAGAALAAAGALLAIGVLDGSQVVVAIVGLAVVAAVSREVARRRRSEAADRRAGQLLAACDGLAADLRAGQPPAVALDRAVDDWPELAPVAAAARFGADVPAALRALAAKPGAGQARVVAAAWQVAHRSGTGLAGALALAAERLRDDRATARVVATELAGAQATARLLAVLPVGVVLLGSGLGGDPVGFLLGSTPGLVCLCTGLALEYAGLSWLARISDSVLGRR
jgi:tight adherence protein B